MYNIATSTTQFPHSRHKDSGISRAIPVFHDFGYRRSPTSRSAARASHASGPAHARLGRPNLPICIGAFCGMFFSLLSSRGLNMRNPNSSWTLWNFSPSVVRGTVPVPRRRNGAGHTRVSRQLDGSSLSSSPTTSFTTPCGARYRRGKVGWRPLPGPGSGSHPVIGNGN